MTSTIERNVPHALSELTPEWLTGVLYRSGAITEADKVEGWTATTIGVGVGLLSDISKLDLQYAAGSGPLETVIAKFDVANEKNHAFAQALQVYEREVRFYQELADEVGECCPKSYYSFVDPSDGSMVLLLEDLTDYQPGDQARGCTLEEAELAIDAAARLHAATWNAQDRENLSWWPRIDGPLYSGGIGGGAATAFAPTMEAFASSVAPEVAAAGERFVAAIPWIHETMATGPQSLIHGDFRQDNFMFGSKPDHRPFVMLDMQAPIITKSIHDIAYLLTQSMDVDVRRVQEKQLVARYHAALSELGVENYSLEQAWDDYRLAAIHCLEYAVIIAGTLEPGNERGLQFAEGCLRRSCQAIVDLDCLSLLPG